MKHSIFLELNIYNNIIYCIYIFIILKIILWNIITILNIDAKHILLVH